jgi:ferredoxin--NADP+ reductase
MQLTNQKHNNHELQPVQITGNNEISPNVFVISWKRTKDFVPGQVIKISANLHEPPRIYSICSGNRDKDLSVLYNVKPGGILTPRLALMKPDDEIFVSDPYGSFSCDNAPAHWISTGTGVAPFYSMIRSGMSKNKTLIHGVSFPNQFYFEDYLKNELGDRYVCCCSREKEGVHFPGRVTDYLASLAELPKEDKYYLCGQALMVVEVRDLLIQKGVPYNQIYAEIFF